MTSNPNIPCTACGAYLKGHENEPVPRCENCGKETVPVQKNNEVESQ